MTGRRGHWPAPLPPGQCPVCGGRFNTKGLGVHMARIHKPRLCRWEGDNRGWCVTHDRQWRIDRAVCEPPEAQAGKEGSGG